MGIGRCGRHLGPAPLPGGGRRGRHVYSHFDILRNGFIDDLLHVALVDGLLVSCGTGTPTVCSMLRSWMVWERVHRLGLGIERGEACGRCCASPTQQRAGWRHHDLVSVCGHYNDGLATWVRHDGLRGKATLVNQTPVVVMAVVVVMLMMMFQS